MTDDQELRVECLRLCGGSVSEAKNAYFWINGEARMSGQTAIDAGRNTQAAYYNQQNLNQQTFGLQAGAQAQGKTQL